MSFCHSTYQPGWRTSPGVGGQQQQVHTLSSETLTSMYEYSSPDTSKACSEVGSMPGLPQHQSHHASEGALRSNASSFGDMETAGISRPQQRTGMPHVDEDIFSMVGGLELGHDNGSNMIDAENAVAGPGLDAQADPSRVLFVKHIPTSVADEELGGMFRLFGDVRQVYAACKHRGFILVTYYDLRAAMAAKNALHGAVAPGQQAGAQPTLEVYYTVPKGDMASSQGMVTMFNLDPDTTNEHLVWLFGKYGAVKDITESPDRPNHKFITFFDTRHAAVAMQAMNRAEREDKVPAHMLSALASSVSSGSLHLPPAQSFVDVAGKGAQQQRSTPGLSQSSSVGSMAHSAWEGPTPHGMDGSFHAGMHGHGRPGAHGMSPSRASSGNVRSVSGSTSPLPPMGTSPMGTSPNANAMHFEQVMANARYDMAPAPAAPHGNATNAMHVSDSASSMASPQPNLPHGHGQTTQLLQAAAAAATARGQPPSGRVHMPHLHHHHAGQPPKLATLSEAQVLDEPLSQQHQHQQYQGNAASMAAQLIAASHASSAMAEANAAADMDIATSMLLQLQLAGNNSASNGAHMDPAAAATATLWNQMQQQQSQGQTAAQQLLLASGLGGAQLGAQLHLQRLQEVQQQLQAQQHAAVQLQAQQHQQLALALQLAQLQGQQSNLQSMGLAAGAGGYGGQHNLGAAAMQLLNMAGLNGGAPGAGSMQGLSNAASMAGLLGQVHSNQAQASALHNLAAAQQVLQQAAALGALNGHPGGVHGMGLNGMGMAGPHSRGSSAGSLAAAAGMLGLGQAAHGGPGSGGGASRDNAGANRGGRLSRRTTDPVAEAERRQQQDRLYALDTDKIRGGEDKRTTLMIKNIPNKYTQKMLLATVDEHFRGLYDFFYLPIDFKNKCNVGYAFINIINPVDIIPLVERFNHRKWERFNSEKVCNISYARIQGRVALVAHFQNSSLMHEDKRCRPILFSTGGPGDACGSEAIAHEPFHAPPPDSAGAVNGMHAGAGSSHVRSGSTTSTGSSAAGLSGSLSPGSAPTTGLGYVSGNSSAAPSDGGTVGPAPNFMVHLSQH